MKKYLFSVLCFCMFTASISARTVISNYENPEITTNDILESFVEELNKPRYAYALYDYDVYKTKGNQDNCWSVEVSDCTYEENRNTVYGEQVTLYTSNGYFTLKTFGGETQESTIANGVKKAVNLNDEDKYEDFYYDMIYDLREFAFQSYKWQKKYDKNTLKGKDISEIFFINYMWLFKFFRSEFILEDDYFYYKISSEDLPDITNFKSYEISSSFINGIMEMSNFEYPMVRSVLSIEYDDPAPESYSKKLGRINYNKIYNTDQKEYNCIILEIVENTEDSKLIETKTIEADEIIYKDNKIKKENIDYIASHLDEDVYYQGIFDKYNKELEENEK